MFILKLSAMVMVFNYSTALILNNRLCICAKYYLSPHVTELLRFMHAVYQCTIKTGFLY